MPTLIKNRYVVVETLGAGGEARVVKALDRQHDRVVALKMRAVPDEGARQELLGEARVLLAVPPHPALPLIVTGPAGATAIWDLRPGSWAKAACSLVSRNLTSSEWTRYLPDRQRQRIC